MLKINEVERIYLGIQGENNARPITIDVSPWIALYPNGSVTIWHKRNGDSVPEATGAVYDSETMTVTWTPDDVDTYVDGEGDAEIRLTDTNVIKKSKWIKTCVSPSVTMAGTTLGSDWASYINAVDGLRAGAVAAKNAAVTAQNAAETAESNAEAWAVGQRGGEDVESTDPAYQNNAKYYKEQAAGSASTASTASTAAVAAKNAAVAAQGAAEVAQLAAVTAQGKAETAQAAAENAQGAAESAQSSAETAKTGAISAKNDAISAKNDAVTAKNAAVVAQGDAENSATTASTKAGEAATSATTASTKAGEAATSAGTASTKASEAAASAGAAGTSALKAEGYAVGDQNGTPVTSGSPYYHNNAEYYAGQASDSATAASGSATTAGTKALVAEGFAVGEQNGTPVTSGSPYYQNNAEYFAGEAADSATAAAASATAAEATTTMIAPAFAEATANDPETYVTNSGVLYYLPDGHEANVTWANTTKTEVKVGSELAGVKSAIVNQTVLLTLIPNKYIVRDNGSEAAYNGWTATDYIAVHPKQRLICHTTTTLSWGARYNENKEYVEPYGWTNNAYYFNSTDKTVYFRISGANADMSSASFTLLPVVDTSLSNIGYAADSKTVGDRMTALESKLSENIPSYYETQLATKEETIRGHFGDCALEGDGFVFITDTHYSSDFFTSDSPTDYFNSNHSPDLIKHIIKKTGISTIVFGGDLMNGTADVDTMLMCVASFGVKFGDRQPRLRFCVGNHEYFTGNDYGQTTKPSASDLYGAGIKYNEDVIAEKGVANTYYYDNAAQKIRYFVVSCGRDTEITKLQVAWLLDKFEHIPDGYKVVVIGHAFINDAMTALRGYHADIVSGLDAVNAGTSYTFDSITYNYSNLNSVKVICVITGHTHVDGSLTSIGGIPIICTTTDSYALNYDMVEGTPTANTRTKGTTDEQAFDVIQFDFTGKKIYCTRIGYGSNREFIYP